MKKKVVILPVLLVIVVAAAVFLYFRLNPGGDSALLTLSGNIEATEVQLGFRIAGQVDERPVSEGEFVRQGELVARLDTSDLQHEVALRRAELRAAQASLAELRAGFRAEEIGQAQAALSRAEADLAESSSDYRRQQKLFGERVISEREFERAQAAYLGAEARVAEARENFNLRRRGYRPEQVDLARAKAEQAAESLARAETHLGYATLLSPIDAFVLSENVEAGEQVAAGTPVVTLGDLDGVWLRAYLDESDLGRVRLGQEAAVTTDSFPERRYRGRISFISSEAEFTPKQVQTREQRTKLVYRVKIAVENPGHELKPGMPADAQIRLEEPDVRH